MNIKEALLAEHSKPQAQRIAQYIGDDADRFSELIKLIMTEEYRIVQRASWVLRHCFELKPELVLPHLDAMVKKLREPSHDAYRRNTLAILSEIDIPEHLMGDLADLCFSWLESREIPVAIRVHSMEVLYQICQHEPELAGELVMLIEMYLPHESAGFVSRGRKVLKKLKKA